LLTVQKAFLRPLLRNPAGSHRLANPRSGRVLADRLTTAFDSKSRRTGLLGRDRFDDGEAILIAPSNAIHTFFMRFSIDIVFARRDGRVVAVRHALRPWRLAISPRAYLVIELPAGTVARTDTRRGDVLAIEPLA
jgi:uncharacterized membrane protein (UPF0127 family)